MSTSSLLTRVALACGAVLAVSLSLGTESALACHRGNHFDRGHCHDDRDVTGVVRGEDRTWVRGEDRTFVRTDDGPRSIDNDDYRCRRRDRDVTGVVRGDDRTLVRGENCSFVFDD